mgnify:CR=1 FL=1
MSCTTNEEVVKLITDFDKQAKALKNEVIKMCWYMRGGVTYSEAMELGHEERENITKLIKDNVETTKKTGLPFF